MDKVKGWMKMEDWRCTLEAEMTRIASGSGVRSEMQYR